MKTITVKQPWASLIVEGLKDIENRTWSTKFRGRVLIHAGLENILKKIKYGESIQFLTNDQIKDATKTSERNLSIFGSILPVGAIIGSVEIVDCVINHPSIWAEHSAKKETRKNKAGVIFVDEIEVPVYNWVLANPIKFPEPIPAKGKLSFWDYPNILAEPEEKDGKLFCHCQLAVKEENQVSGDSRFGYYCRYCGGKWYK